jgi:hypothetical protein
MQRERPAVMNKYGAIGMKYRSNMFISKFASAAGG